MKKTTIVAFLLLTSGNLFASTINSEINSIESRWANIYYAENSTQQKDHFPALIKQTQELAKKHPKQVEPLIWQAILIATNAAYEAPFDALHSINKAKTLLEHCIKKQPKALSGAAQVALATLYYMTPGWPISFGDDARAETLFKKALQINPLSIDSNYFYGDYLLTKNDIKNARTYFKRAIEAPIRKNQQFADIQLKKEAFTALKNTEDRKLTADKSRFLSLFSSANAK